MKPRLGAVLAWGQWLFFLVCIGFGIYFWSFTSTPIRILPITIAFFSFATFGAVIASRRPGNTIGWLFCAIGIGTALTYSTGSYVGYSTILKPGTLSGAALADWLGNLVWPLNLGFGAFLLLLFPDGRLLSRRWRPLAWILDICVVANALSSALLPGAFSGERTVNPFGIQAAGGLLSAINNVSQGAFQLAVLVVVGAVILRFWRARGEQRQQVKWFALCVVLGTLIILLGVILIPENSPLSNLPFSIAFALIPIGAGIAVLKYRLYDIDILINRTLVYGLLTTILAGVYFGGVYGAQFLVNSLLPARAGQQSPVLIVASTLLVAALFTPLRRGIQATIDRRFYRRKYNATRTLARFNATLRGEVDLSDLQEHLVRVVDETMRPAYISLWLRESPRTPPGARESPREGGMA